MATISRQNYVKSTTMGGYTPRPMFCDGCGSPIDGSDAHFEVYIDHGWSAVGGYITCHHICASDAKECIDKLFDSLIEDNSSSS
jgi:hypothetical protein